MECHVFQNARAGEWKFLERNVEMVEGRDSPERLVSKTKAAGVTECPGSQRLQTVRLPRGDGCDQGREEKGTREKRPIKNRMLIFGHSGIKGLRQKAVRKGVSLIINAQR